MIKIVFFGTHTFATTILQGLIDDRNIDVSLVVTQPDKPVGRKKIMTPPPVKILAEKAGIPIAQPPSLKQWEMPVKNIDLGITAQYGLIIPKHILDAPQHGMINVHTSLLPKYRGASPIQSALIAGEIETGVTIMLMDVGLDTGPILLQKSLIIDKQDTYLTLDEKLATLGNEALLEAIPQYLNNTLKPFPQDETLATHCKQFSREDGKIDWHQSTQTIYNRYKGLTPWPGIWTTWGTKRLKLLAVTPNNHHLNPGLVAYKDNQLLIGTTDASLEILELQLEGKKATDAKTFMNGYKQFDGTNVISNEA